MQFPSIEIFEHVESLKVIIDFFLGRERQFCQLQQNLARSRMSIAKRVLTNFQRLQEHLLALRRVVGLQLLKSKTVVGGNGERVIGTEMVAEKVQRFLIKLDSLIDLFFLTVILQQDLEGSD